MSGAIHRETEELLLHEAELLDRGAYAAWGALYDTPCLYWVPVDPALTAPDQGVSHVCDDRQMLDARIHRLLEPRYNQPEPTPRTVHVLSGVRVEQHGDTLIAHSATLVSEYRARGYGEDDRRLFAGRTTHTLRRTPEGLRIAAKRIDLVDSTASFNAILVPL
jgi:3-phenylpropionate/cinnamic acid dioxygenase small subunit